MNFVIWVIFGAVVGWITNSFILHREEGCFTNVILGVAGSIIGGLIFQQFGGQGITGFNLYSIFVSVIGAVVLVAIINLARGR